MTRRWLLATMLCAGCPDNSTPPVTITLASVLDRTGSIAAPTWGDAVKLAASDANSGLEQAGEGIRFNFVVADSTNAPMVAVMRATDLVKNQGARGVVTDSSQDDIALNTLYYDADMANDLDVPIVCMACTSPAINNPAAMNPNDPVNQATLHNGKKWNFRTVMSTTLQARILIKIALAKGTMGDVNGDGKFKVSVYASDEPFGRGFAGAIRMAAEELKPGAIVEVVYHAAMVDSNSYNWNGDVQKLADNMTDTTADGLPDVIMEVTFPQYIVGFLKAYETTAQSVPLFHTHVSRMPSVVRTLQQAIEGDEGTSHVILDNGASGSEFSKAFKALSTFEPGFLDSNTYDAAVSLELAAYLAARALPDPAAVTGGQVRDALFKINDKAGVVIRTGPAEFKKAVEAIKAGMPINYEGASGPNDFDANGNVVGRIAHWKVQNVQFTDLRTFDCVASSECPEMR